MSKGKIARLVGGAVAAIAALGLAVSAQAQEKKLKIGVVYDLTGPFAGGGSELQYIGAKIMLDHFIKHGGVEGYKIEAIYADAQSKPDVAINEAVAPGRAGKGRHAAGLLFLGAVRAGGRQRRAAQEVHVDHHLHFLGGAGEPPSEVRVPRPAERHRSSA